MWIDYFHYFLRGSVRIIGVKSKTSYLFSHRRNSPAPRESDEVWSPNPRRGKGNLIPYCKSKHREEVQKVAFLHMLLICKIITINKRQNDPTYQCSMVTTFMVASSCTWSGSFLVYVQPRRRTSPSVLRGLKSAHTHPVGGQMCVHHLFTGNSPLPLEIQEVHYRTRDVLLKKNPDFIKQIQAEKKIT